MSLNPDPPIPGHPESAYNQSLRDSAAQEFQADSPYRRLAARELADSLHACHSVRELIASALDAEIRASWDDVSSQHPNASSPLRTVLAWKAVARQPGYLALLSLRHQASSAMRAQSDNSRRLQRGKEGL
jgi:hypothetical protein